MVESVALLQGGEYTLLPTAEESSVVPLLTYGEEGTTNYSPVGMVLTTLHGRVV